MLHFPEPETVQQALRTAVEDASAARMERIAVVGGDGESAAELVTHAAALNSERMVLVGPDALDSGGKTLPGVFAAAALAGVIASGRDPGVPLNGAEIRGLGGLGTAYTDNDIDLLVRGGVTPLESTAGTVSPVRGITTRTTTGGAADTTWRELTTILIKIAGSTAGPAQQVRPGQKHGPKPQRHPLSGDCGAGEEGGRGDHRQLWRGDGDGLGG